MGTLTQPQIDRLSYMSRIATHTTDENRAYHHAMIDAGWKPIISDNHITWTVTNPNSSWDYDAARIHYDDGRGCTPTPF